MHRRKFLQYAAASGLGLLGGGYLHKYGANAEPVVPSHTDLPAARAGAHTPLFIPGNSGPLGILDVTDAPISFTTPATTLPLLPGMPSPFLIYDTRYGSGNRVVAVDANERRRWVEEGNRLAYTGLGRKRDHSRISEYSME